MNGEGFDLLAPNYTSHVFKGYFFPLIIAVQLKLAQFLHVDQFLFIKLCNALGLAITAVYILPSFFNKLFDIKLTKINIISYILLSQFFLFFWGGFLHYPLSDFPSAIFFILGILFLLYTSDARNRIIGGGFLLVAGMCFAAAYNIRSIYLFGFYGFLIYIFVISFKSSGIKNAVLYTTIFLAGFIILELPQFYINVEKYGQYSILLTSKGVNLLLLRYGTSIIDYFAVVGVGGLYVRDPSGVFVFGGRASFMNYGDYVKFLLENPAFQVGFYFKKLISSLDIKYDTTYVIDYFKNMIIFRNFNYLIIFLGIISFIIKKISLRQLVICSLFFLPAFVALFGAVESRYFLLIYILLYYRASFITIPHIIDLFLKNGLKATTLYIRRTVSIFLVFIAFIMFMNYFSISVMAMAEPLPLYSNKPKSAPALITKNEISSGESFMLETNKNEIYNIYFRLENPSRCEKIIISNGLFEFSILPHFYRKNYHAYIKGTGDNMTLTFSFFPNNEACEVRDLKIQ